MTKNQIFLILTIFAFIGFPSSLHSEGCDYLVICDPQFESAANTLADWRHKTGLLTKVTTTYETGSFSAEIRSYIQNAYNNWTPAPEYVLFIGDAEFIPTNYETIHPYEKIPTGTDLYYGTLEGDDYFPDIFLGRISVDTPNEANKRVNDIINYEKNGLPGSFYNTVALCTYFEDFHPYPCPDGWEDGMYTRTIENLAVFFSHPNYLNRYSVNRIYFTTGLSGFIAEAFYTKPTDPLRSSLDDYFDSPMNKEYVDVLPPYLKKPGIAWDVCVSGNYAYVACWNHGLRIIDISNPSSPEEVGYYDTPGYAYGVYISGNYAYVADGESGLRIIDIKDPSSPFEVGHCPTPGDGTLCGARGVYVSGDYAYVANYHQGLRVINISNPSLPEEVGNHWDTPENAFRLCISGNYAYVADGLSGLRIIDITDPLSPSEKGYYDTPDTAHDVYVSGNYAYVADLNSLIIIDISTPESPSEVGEYDTTGRAYGVYVSGNYAYVADGESGLSIIDISNPSLPSEVDYYDTPEVAVGTYLSGNYVYVADGDSGLRIIDISNLSFPTEVGHYDTPPGFVWDGAGEDVSDAVNLGCFLVVHRGHGEPTMWSLPTYRVSDVLGLTNGNLLPVVWSINCSTGWFDNETSEEASHDICFSEAWERNPSGGAVGVIAPTRKSWTRHNDRLVSGFTDAIWPSFIIPDGSDASYQMGAVLNYGKEYLATLIGEEDGRRRTTFEMYHWFGDPATEIWTDIPQPLTVTHYHSVQVGYTGLIKVRIQPADELVKVCLYKEGELFSVLTVTGQADFDLSQEMTVSLTAGEIDVTVTAHNFIPYTGKITVTGTEPEDCTPPECKISQITSDPDMVTTDDLYSGLVTISGTAQDYQSGLLGYTVSYGAGAYPTTWTEIEYLTTPVEDGELATWDTVDSGITEGVYTIKVEAVDNAPAPGHSSEDTVTINIDNTPPVISNLQTPLITDTSVKITWRTDELSDSTVEYGDEPGVYPDFVYDAVLKTFHNLGFNELVAPERYYYQVKSTNEVGLTSSAENSFDTIFRYLATPGFRNGNWLVVESNTLLTPIITNPEISSVEYLLDDGSKGSFPSPFEWYFDITGVSGGIHTISMIANPGNFRQDIIVWVDNFPRNYRMPMNFVSSGGGGRKVGENYVSNDTIGQSVCGEKSVGISYIVHPGFYGGFDTVPPDKVIDLSVTGGPDKGEVTLTWTAPGDDGQTGDIIGGQYRLRYSETTPISSYELKWTTNTTPGSIEVKIVGGLEDDTVYYFKLQTGDEMAAWSEWSDEASAKTLLVAESAEPTPVVTVAYETATLLEETTEVYIVTEPTTTSRAVVAISSAAEADKGIISDLYDIGPDSAVFSVPASLTFNYTDEEVPPGVNETELNVYRWDPDVGWQIILPKEQDTEENWIKVWISSVSLFAILSPLPDILPPRTTLNIGEPKYLLSSSSQIVVRVDTPFILSSIDDSVEVGDEAGKGVAKTQWRADSGEWVVYINTAPGVGEVFITPEFNLSGVSEGEHIISYFSEDVFDNCESISSMSVTLDNTAPLLELISPSPESIGVCKVFRSSLPVIGTTGDLHFDSYKVEYASGTDAVDGFITIKESSIPVTEGELCIWDTLSLTTGYYTLKVSAKDKLDNESSVETTLYIGEPQLIISFGSGTLSHPEGIAVDNQNFIYVADRNNDLIKKFDFQGNLVKIFGEEPGLQFSKPKGIVIDNDNNIYISDANNHRIIKTDNEGNLLFQIGNPGNDAGEFNHPSGIALDIDGNIYVADTNNGRVQKFDSQGNFLMEFPVSYSNTDETQMDHLWGISLDEEGNIYVSIQNEDCVRKFDPEGNLLMEIGESGTWLGQFNKPQGITVDNPGYIYVCDRNNNRIQKFDRYGNPVVLWGCGGREEGRFNKPAGIALDDEGNVYIADRNNSRIQVFGLKESVEEPDDTPPVPPDVSGEASAFIKIPKDGMRIKGNAVTVFAKVTSNTTAVQLQCRKSTDLDWTNISEIDTKKPYAVYWNVNVLEKGNYSLRAVAYDKDNKADIEPDFITVTIADTNCDIIENDSPDADSEHRMCISINPQINNEIILADGTSILLPPGVIDNPSSLKVNILNPDSVFNLLPPEESTIKPIGAFRKLEFSDGTRIFNTNITLTIPYLDENNDGIVDGTDIPEDTLKILYLDEGTGKWIEVINSQNSTLDLAQYDSSFTEIITDNCISAKVNHFTIFGLMGFVTASDLADVIVYPNPYEPNSGLGHDKITFDGLTPNAGVKIYTIAGELVIKLPNQTRPGQIEWAVTSEDGSKVVSGVYVYIVQDGENKPKLGKIAVLR